MAQAKPKSVAARGGTKPGKPIKPGKRGRPTADRVAAIDAAIHAAAMELFLELGFEAASMDAIAAAAPVSKGTLYTRYESKELLFRAVIEDRLEHLSRRAGERDHLLPDALEPRLRHHAQTLIEVLSWPEFQRLARLIESATLAFPDINRIWQEIAMRRFVDFLAEAMAGARFERETAGVDWHFYANLFLHALAGWHRTETSMREVGNAEFHRYCEQVIQTIIAALRQDPARSD